MKNEKEVPVGFHIHLNGGGLVQDTCTVDSSVFVGPNARVYGDARVYGNAWVYDNARVSGDAWVSGDARVSGDAQVYGNARVYGDAWVSSPLYVQGTRHALTNSRYGHIAVGCHERTFEYWQEHYKAIGRAEGYTKEEIEQYGLFIQMFSKIGK